MAINRNCLNDGKHTVFISYAHENFDKAKRLYEDLRFAGLHPWLDDESLIAGSKWKIVIEETIKNSRFFILLFSKSLSKKQNSYVQKEIEYALDLMKKLPQSYVFVIPVKLDSSKIPYQDLMDLQYIDMFPSWEKGLKRLLIAMDIKLDIRNGVMENYYNNNNIESAYAKAISCISNIKYSRIRDKEKNVFIKASFGSHLMARIIGYHFSDPKWLRIDVFINFQDRKITISDASGHGIQWPAGSKIITNMRETATIIKECIDD